MRRLSSPGSSPTVFVHARHEGCCIQYLGLVPYALSREPTPTAQTREPTHMNSGHSQNESVTFSREGVCHGSGNSHRWSPAGIAGPSGPLHAGWSASRELDAHT